MKTNSETLNEHFRCIAMNCPLGNNKSNCPFIFYRKLERSILEKTIGLLSTEFKLRRLYQHSKCFQNNTESFFSRKYQRNTRTTHLIWTNKTSIDYLTYELKRNGWIKSQNEFTKLFLPDETIHCLVRWNGLKKEELAYLFSQLRKDEFIMPCGSKGYFNYLEKHIVDFENKKIPNNYLKKISFLINRNPLKYENTIKTIRCILTQIMKSRTIA